MSKSVSVYHHCLCEEVSNTFENGAYFTLSSDDIKSFADESIYDVDDIKDMLCFMKYDGMTTCGSYVFGALNSDLYSELLELFKVGDYCDLESLLK